MLCHARNIHAKKSHRKRFLQLLASAELRRDLPQRRQECDQQKEIFDATAIPRPARSCDLVFRGLMHRLARCQGANHHLISTHFQR
ncbi:hypothetical protein LA06_01005 [Xanthomonas oryzae pv. oryzae]|nr:hypothetical protein LA06_01005 [Xanthomonas oryzae pv. oryzae]PNR64894.1 hypothetical protein LA07_00950 [Xanthomonas oryzae pv. oryzae]